MIEEEYDPKQLDRSCSPAHQHSPFLAPVHSERGCANDPVPSDPDIPCRTIASSGKGRERGGGRAWGRGRCYLRYPGLLHQHVRMLWRMGDVQYARICRCSRHDIMEGDCNVGTDDLAGADGIYDCGHLDLFMNGSCSNGDAGTHFGDGLGTIESGEHVGDVVEEHEGPSMGGASVAASLLFVFLLNSILVGSDHLRQGDVGGGAKAEGQAQARGGRPGAVEHGGRRVARRCPAWEARWIGGSRRGGPRATGPRARAAAAARYLFVIKGGERGEECGGGSEPEGGSIGGEEHWGAIPKGRTPGGGARRGRPPPRRGTVMSAILLLHLFGMGGDFHGGLVGSPARVEAAERDGGGFGGWHGGFNVNEALNVLPVELRNPDGSPWTAHACTWREAPESPCCPQRVGFGLGTVADLASQARVGGVRPASVLPRGGASSLVPCVPCGALRRLRLAALLQMQRRADDASRRRLAFVDSDEFGTAATQRRPGAHTCSACGPKWRSTNGCRWAGASAPALPRESSDGCHAVEGHPVKDGACARRVAPECLCCPQRVSFGRGIDADPTTSVGVGGARPASVLLHGGAKYLVLRGTSGVPGSCWFAALLQMQRRAEDASRRRLAFVDSDEFGTATTWHDPGPHAHGGCDPTRGYDTMTCDGFEHDLRGGGVHERPHSGGSLGRRDDGQPDGDRRDHGYGAGSATLATLGRRPRHAGSPSPPNALRRDHDPTADVMNDADLSCERALQFAAIAPRAQHIALCEHCVFDDCGAAMASDDHGSPLVERIRRARDFRRPHLDELGTVPGDTKRQSCTVDLSAFGQTFDMHLDRIGQRLRVGAHRFFVEYGRWQQRVHPYAPDPTDGALRSIDVGVLVVEYAMLRSAGGSRIRARRRPGDGGWQTWSSGLGDGGERVNAIHGDGSCVRHGTSNGLGSARGAVDDAFIPVLVFLALRGVHGAQNECGPIVAWRLLGGGAVGLTCVVGACAGLATACRRRRSHGSSGEGAGRRGHGRGLESDWNAVNLHAAAAWHRGARGGARRGMWMGTCGAGFAVAMLIVACATGSAWRSGTIGGISNLVRPLARGAAEGDIGDDPLTWRHACAMTASRRSGHREGDACRWWWTDSSRVGEAANPGPPPCFDVAYKRHLGASGAAVQYPTPGGGCLRHYVAPGFPSRASGQPEQDGFNLTVETVNPTGWTALKRRLDETDAHVVLAQETWVNQSAAAGASAWARRRGWRSVWSHARTTAKGGTSGGSGDIRQGLHGAASSSRCFP